MIIAHDLGTTGDKASLHTNDGVLVTSSNVSYITDFRAGGIAEQNPADWWSAVSEATYTLLSRAGVSAADISAVGFSGQMMGAVFLDERMEPVRPAIIWADRRSKDEAERLHSALDAKDAYWITGHRIDPTYSLSKIMWVRDHEPHIFERTRHVCLPKDYIVGRMTGRLVTDPSDASSTNAYDQRSGRWSHTLLVAAGVDPAVFPEVVPSTTVVGSVLGSVAAESGLYSGTPVVIGGGDGPIAAVGAGVIDPSDGSYVCLGSSSWISMCSNAPLYDPMMRSMTFNHVVDGQYVPTATMQAGGASLDWIAEAVGAKGPDELNELMNAAADASSTGLYFLPHLLGERSPYWNPAARGVFLGLERHHGPANLVRAVVEGIAFNLRTCLAGFVDAGRQIGRVDAIGGGASSDFWLQTLANVWGIPVRRRTIREDGNSLGAAVVTAVGAGMVESWSVARELSQVTATFEPDDHQHEMYTDRHQHFLSAYRRLEPWFESGYNA